MQVSKLKRILKWGGAFLALLTLTGCQIGVLNPKGDIGVQEKELIIIATLLMLIVVVPVIFMSIYFPYRYRSSNKDATYTPEWSHSNKIEFVVWAVPIIIIIILGTITWKTTHSLDQYKSIEHENEEMVIDVVALDWQWLFIYPEEKIATINYVAFPKDTPVKFRLTAHEAMNSFFIPQLGSQMYGMAAMASQLNLIANEAGDYKGVSSGFSGPGFSHMKFTAHVTETQEEYQQWIESVKTNPEAKVLNDFDDYLELAKPTENAPVSYYSSVPENLFAQVVNQYPGSMNHGMDGMSHEQMTDGEMSHGEMSHGDMSHDEMSHGDDMSHGDMDHQQEAADEHASHSQDSNDNADVQEAEQDHQQHSSDSSDAIQE